MDPNSEEVLHALREFGVLKRMQLNKLLKKDSEDVNARKTIGWLIKKGFLFTYGIKGEYVMASPKLRPNERIILAFDILLQFINRIDRKEYIAATFPAQIFFQIKKREYEIAVFFADEGYLISLYMHSNKENADETKIIGLTDERLIERIPSGEGKYVIALFSSDQTDIHFYESPSEKSI